MGGEDRTGQGSQGDGEGTAQGQAGDIHNAPGSVQPREPQRGGDLEHPGQSPLFYAEHGARYERQRLIRRYEEHYDCRLVVLVDVIFDASITYFEELIYDADPAKDLHLLLSSPGGDGEVAVRLVRSAQARCRELIVIVPDQAKSAATILALGAHRILMGPTSDLGPVDPQFLVGRGNLVAAKDIIASVEQASQAIADNPDVYPLYAALLSDVSGLMVQQARSALGRTEDLVEEALRSQPQRDEAEVQHLKEQLRQPLIDAPKHHGAIFSARDAREAGLPVVELDPASNQWQVLWRLWAMYFSIAQGMYEGARASRPVAGA